MGLTSKAKQLLEEVAHHIELQPKRLNMGHWISKNKDKKSNDKQKDGFARNVDAYGYARCGTAACIAGWVVLLHDGKEQPLEGYSVPERAAELLGLKQGYNNYLFYPTDWDAPYKDEYANAATVTGKAKIAAKYIRHYIKTRGAKQKPLDNGF